MNCSHLHLLIVVMLIWFPLTLIITYVLAVIQDHVRPFLPYISYTAASPPESCIFSQFFGMGLVLLGFAMYVRYLLVKKLCKMYNLSCGVQKLNNVTTIIGLLTLFAISFASNFQEIHVKRVHLAGASAGFFLGTLYMVLQTIISRKLLPVVGTLRILYLRVILSFICFVTNLVSGSVGYAASRKVRGEWLVKMKWSSKDGGYDLHIISVACQWLTAIGFLFYNSTFYSEFRYIILSEPIIQFKNVETPIGL